MDPKCLFSLAVAAALGSFGVSLVSAGTVNINPSKDNTVYEYHAVDGTAVTRLDFIASRVREG